MFVAATAIPVQPASLVRVLNASSERPSSPARSTGIEASQVDDAQTQRQTPDDYFRLDGVLRDNRSHAEWNGQNDEDEGSFGQIVPRTVGKYAGMLPADYTIFRPHTSHSDQGLRHGESDQPVSKVAQIVPQREHAFHENLPGQRAENAARDAQDPSGLQQSSHDLRILKAFQKLSILGRSPEIECAHIKASACSSRPGSQFQSGEMDSDMLASDASDHTSPCLNGGTIAPDCSSHERAAIGGEDIEQKALVHGDGSSAATHDPWQMELEEAMADGNLFRNGDPMLRSQPVRLLCYTPSQTALASANFSPNTADAKKQPVLPQRGSSTHNNDSNHTNSNASLQSSSLESLGERVSMVSDGKWRRGCGGKTERGRVLRSSLRGSFSRRACVP